MKKKILIVKKVKQNEEQKLSKHQDTQKLNQNAKKKFKLFSAWAGKPGPYKQHISDRYISILFRTDCLNQRATCIRPLYYKASHLPTKELFFQEKERANLHIKHLFQGLLKELITGYRDVSKHIAWVPNLT